MAEQIVIHKDDIVMEGFMVKQSKHLKEWRQRWFVLTSQYLCSFKAEGDYTNPTEYVRLAECSTVKSAEDSTGKENSFCVQTAQRSFCLIARNAAEKEQWISRIGRQMVRRAVLIEDYEWTAQKKIQVFERKGSSYGFQVSSSVLVTLLWFDPVSDPSSGRPPLKFLFCLEVALPRGSWTFLFCRYIVPTIITWMAEKWTCPRLNSWFGAAAFHVGMGMSQNDWPHII